MDYLPLDQIKLRRELKHAEMCTKPGESLLQDRGKRVEVRFHLESQTHKNITMATCLTHQGMVDFKECHIRGSVEYISKAHKCIGGFQVEQENGSKK